MLPSRYPAIPLCAAWRVRHAAQPPSRMAMAPFVAARWLLLRRRPETGCSAAYAKYRRMRGCAAPSADRIFEIFAHVARHELRNSAGALVQAFEPELTNLQLQILEL